MAKKVGKARMPTSPIRSKAARHYNRDAGFSLVELLAVLAILSLMLGAVVFNLPKPRSETDAVSAAMTAQVSRFLDNGAVAGEVRALGLDADALVLFRHDGRAWSRAAELSWPNAARVTLNRNGERTALPEVAAPTLLFEPYGAVPDFTLTLGAREAQYILSANARGQIERTVER
jgi:prepilin-type N-terminal cleavage/methylation domain-containing protein